MTWRRGRVLRVALRWFFHLAGLPFPPRRPRVLLFHSIDPWESPISVSPDFFARVLDYLRRKRFVTWPASRYVEALAAGAPLPRRLVVLTFDDGFRSVIRHALPLLQARGMCASVFLVTANTGAEPRWHERGAARIRQGIDSDFSPRSDEAGQSRGFWRFWTRFTGVDRLQLIGSLGRTMKEPIANWDEITAAAATGSLEFLSHTRTHPFLDELGEPQIEAELLGSRDDLAGHGLAPGRVFAWTYGVYDARARTILEDHGFAGAFLAEFRPQLCENPDPLRLNRIPVDQTLGVFGIAFSLGRGYEFWTWVKERLPRPRESRADER